MLVCVNERARACVRVYMFTLARKRMCVRLYLLCGYVYEYICENNYNNDNTEVSIIYIFLVRVASYWRKMNISCNRPINACIYYDYYIRRTSCLIRFRLRL